jgi:hypothetical protein
MPLPNGGSAKRSCGVIGYTIMPRRMTLSSHPESQIA